MKMIFNYDANKIYFHNKGFALSLVLKVRFFGTRKWPIFEWGIAAILNLAMSRGRASTSQTFFAGEKMNSHVVLIMRNSMFNRSRSL